MQEDGRVVHELRVRDFFPVNEEAVGHQWVPVVQVAELQSDAVAVLETLTEEQGGVELQFKQVATQMLHVLLDYDVNNFAWKMESIYVN